MFYAAFVFKSKDFQFIIGARSINAYVAFFDELAVVAESVITLCEPESFGIVEKVNQSVAVINVGAGNPELPFQTPP